VGHVALHGVRLVAGGRTLVDDLTLNALPGELIAVVGPNGVGKTTLLRALAGFVAPAAGRITLDGVDVAALAPRERARAVTLIGSDTETPSGTTVREVVATGRFAYRPWWDWTQPDEDGPAIEAALARVDLTGFAERDFETLSAGERQRAWLALALAQDTRLVLLDEPTSHLDPRHALEVSCVMRGIARDATTAFVVSHDLNEAAAIADRIAVLGDGRLLICAPPHEALEPELLERAYGIAFDRVTLGGAVRVIARGYRPQNVATEA
jgi:iron complex transport system ATP-binding protein